MLDLTARQRSVIDRVLAEESARRNHLVVYLSGSHAYGFPSKDSDLDIKAAHVADTRELLGLHPTQPARNRLEVIDGVEIDYTSNEVQGVVLGCIKGNGNYLERVLGKRVLFATPNLEPLRELVAKNLSQRVENHYVGFATSQLKAFDAAEQPTAKKILYVLRTSLTGKHLLETGELEVNLGHLLERYGYEDAREMIERKRAQEQLPLGEAEQDHWRARAETAIDLVRAARADSVLPPEPLAVADLEEWLIELRRQTL
jgi:predicted nucleotidyltransferase